MADLFKTVPYDVVISTLSLVDWEDFENIRLVCKQWNKCAKDSRLKEEMRKSINDNYVSFNL